MGSVPLRATRLRRYDNPDFADSTGADWFLAEDDAVSNKPPTDTPEAKARFGRLIDEAFEEASRLAGSSLPPTEFYDKFLNRALSAIDAPAGVVWLRTPQGFLQIACQVNLDKVGLDQKRGGRQCHNEILRQVFQSQPARPVMVEPQGRLQGVTAEAGGVPAANLTDYYALFAPIVNNEKQPFGLLEVFQDPALDPRMYQTFLQYAVQMAGYASQYHSFSSVRQASGLEKVFAQIESFARQIHSTLNPTEVAYHVANEGRRLIECDRLCVGVRHGKKTTVESVSGADVVEKASTHVRRMRALFDAVLKFGDRLTYRGSKDEGLPPDLSHALDDYLAESQPKLLVIQPIRDDREKDNGKPARSVLLMESFNPPEQVEPLIQRLEVVGKHAAGALYNASEMKRIPFGFIWKPIAAVQEGIGGKNRFYWILGTIGVVLLAAAMVLVPYPLKLDAKGEYLPEINKYVYAPHPGIVREIQFKPGDARKPGSPMVQLHSPELQTKFREAEQEMITAQSQISQLEQLRSRGGLPNDREQELISQIAKHRATATTRESLLRSMREMYSIAPGSGASLYFTAIAPNDEATRAAGVGAWKVLSGDNRNELMNRTVRQDEPLLRVGYVEGNWRVEMKVPQRAIGHIAKAFVSKGQHRVDKDNKKYLDVDVLVTSRPETSYPGRLYEEDMARQAEPNRDDHNESEPVMLAYVRVNQDTDGKIPEELKVAGVEVHAKIKCGDQPLGYSLFHGVWEWFYENVVFFF